MDNIQHTQLTHDKHKYLGYKYPLAFMLDNIIDPINVGAAFRLADALGAEKICLLGDTPYPPNRIITKTARSTEKYVPWEHYDKMTECLSKITAEGYSIISAEITDNSKELSDFKDFKKFNKICLVVGAENKGICQEILDYSIEVVHIKMVGINSSMNAITALSIIAYQIISQWLNK